MTKLKNDIYVLILAGGSGTRLWPLSRIKEPKQLLSLYGKKTLIEETLNRSLKLTKKENIFIGTNKELKKEIQKKKLGLHDKNFVIEPEAKNTAPVIALFCAQLLKKKVNEKSSVIVLSADHYIFPVVKWEKTIKNILSFADDNIWCMGIKPTRAETQYGYIELGEPIQKNNFFNIKSFKEKPDKKTADKYFKSGQYLWNSGMFVFNLEIFWRELLKTAPEIANLAQKATFDTKSLKKYFALMPSISIDYAVLEKSEKLRAASCDFLWDDVGGFYSLKRILAADSDTNYLLQKINYKSVNSKNNIIYSNDKNQKIALLGVNDLVIINHNGILLIANESELNKLKDLREKFNSPDL
ncbi:MAG: mannose-1-phosphate guanylyltransferase [Spirochaetia bacterium]|nr:mannose-1-phosphate guanylyltransferase [Spirochaetia bacterium]